MIRYSAIGAVGYVCGEMLRMMVAHPEGELVNVLDSFGVGDPISLHHPALRGFYDQKIMDLLKELWATGDTQKVADGVLGAEFIWQEDLNKIPGLNTMVKQDLDLIQSVGMLEAVKSIL